MAVNISMSTCMVNAFFSFRGRSRLQRPVSCRQIDAACFQASHRAVLTPGKPVSSDTEQIRFGKVQKKETNDMHVRDGLLSRTVNGISLIGWVVRLCSRI
jgi:hypothetical protein